MTKKKVLDAINDQYDNKGEVSNKGIVSTIGRANVDRKHSAGDPVPYNDNNNKMLEVGYCDSLAKVLFRTMDSKGGNPGAVYTSVIHNVADAKLYFSFQGNAGGANPAGLNNGQVDNLVDQLKAADVNPINLFVTMIQYRNNIMENKLIKYIKDNPSSTFPPSPFDQSLNSLKNYHQLQQSKKLIFHQAQKQYLLQNQEFQKFVEKEAIAIDDFGAIRNFLRDKSYSLVDFIKNGQESNYGVHVEAKGIYEARQKGAIKTGTFNVGLAIVKEKEPAGCCAGCSAEFNALSKVHKGLIINRTNDLPYNFPPTNYQVSHNVKKDKDENVLKKFSKIILKNAYIVNDEHELNLTNKLENFKKVIEEEFAPKVQEEIEEEEWVRKSPESTCGSLSSVGKEDRDSESEARWQEDRDSESEARWQEEIEEEEFDSWEARYDTLISDVPSASNEPTLTAVEMRSNPNNDDVQDY
jgi:hypothetical protein